MLLAVTLFGYTALHCIHLQWFYKNHFKRGFGPEPPPATAGASGAWAWVVLVARMPLDEIERHAGSDARVLLEFIALAMKILTAYALMATLQLAAYLVASYQAVHGCYDSDTHTRTRAHTQLKAVWLELFAYIRARPWRSAQVSLTPLWIARCTRTACSMLTALIVAIYRAPT